MATHPMKPKPLPPLSPSPAPGEPWDWRARYWGVGDRVTVGGAAGPGGPGWVVGFSRNRFGRLSYRVRLDSGEVLARVPVEALAAEGGKACGS